MRLVRYVALALVLGVVVAPKPAAAIRYELGLGANYWFEKSGIFDLTLAIEAPLARHLSAGGRLGAALVTSPATASVPLDLVVRGSFSRAYIELLGGPWIFFQGNTVRGHFAGGFGLQTRHVSAGVEIGYLDPNAIIGLKIGFPL